MTNDFNNDEIDETEEPTTMQKIKEWMQENLRIIVSVLIVFLIAASIYSYSKRGAENTEVATEDTSEIEDILTDLSTEEEGTETETPAENEDAGEEVATQDTQKPAEEQKAQEPKQETPQVTGSTETDNSFIEVAQQGDGTTHLARKALANYLAKNADSSLTNEHKIYIEDYLRKNISQKGGVSVGTSVEFSKSLIQQAISASKNLNDSQLKNLQKYSARVNF